MKTMSLCAATRSLTVVASIAGCVVDDEAQSEPSGQGLAAGAVQVQADEMGIRF